MTIAPKKKTVRNKKVKLTPYEQETIINFNKGEDTACIFTYEKTWQKHLEQKLGLIPVRDNDCGGKEYQLPKARVRLPQKRRQYSEVTKKKMSVRLTSTRKRKQLELL